MKPRGGMILYEGDMRKEGMILIKATRIRWMMILINNGERR